MEDARQFPYRLKSVRVSLPTRMKDESNFEDDEEFMFDEVTGGRSKKPVMSVLNKKKVSKHEMDDLFAEDY